MGFASTSSAGRLLQDEFDAPSFSLGIEDDCQDASFSIGIGGAQPPTPSVTQAEGFRLEESQANETTGAAAQEDSDTEEMPRRRLKRLRRGLSTKHCEDQQDDPEICTAPEIIAGAVGNDVDDIEDFSSDEETPAAKTQKWNQRSFSTLKTIRPVETPPVYDKKPPASTATPPEVAVTRSSLGTKEVSFRVNSSTPSSSAPRYDKIRTPVYDFRENRIFIDIEDDSEEEPATSASTARGRSEEIAALLRQRLPHFSFIDELEQGSGGEPIYINYRAQFGSEQKPTPRTAEAGMALTATEDKRKKGRKRASRAKKSSARQGYWITQGGRRVYVDATGRRSHGKEGYMAFRKETGKKGGQQKKRQSKGKKSRS